MTFDGRAAGAPEAAAFNEFYAAARELRGAFIEQAIWLDLLVTEV